MSYHHAEIRSVTGAVYHVVEYPSRVLELYQAALAVGPGALLELETPAIPRGQKVYIAAGHIESIAPAP